jgi:SAM-dependent methyltransferase
MGPQLDQAKSQSFAQRMLGTLNQASVALMTVTGHKVGLFDLMADLPASTSEQIAAAGALDERYVREWLGAMVTGAIVEYDPAERTYRLPPEHAAYLTRSAGADNLAVMMQFVPMMASVESKVAECFREGGGVAYSHFDDFHPLMVECSGGVQDASLLSTTLPLVPGIVEKLHSGIDVLDVGCGSGHAVNVMARAYLNSRFVGYDFSEEGVAAGRAESKQWGLANTRFEVKDVSSIGDRASYDFITAFDAIHDQAAPRAVLQEIANALRPDGTFLMVDIAASSNLEENLDHVLGPYLYSISTFHCMTVSLALGGEGLGTAWGEQKARELLTEAGFARVDVKRVEKDIINNYYIAGGVGA